MNLNVEVKVTLPGGALVTPSASQQKAINEFASKLLGGEPTKKRFLGIKAWTPEEDTVLKREMALTDSGKMTTKLAERLAKEMGRTISSISSRAWNLQNGKA